MAIIKLHKKDNMKMTSADRTLKVAIQGVAGCFHDAAAHAYFADREIEIAEYDTFPAMFDALAADASMVAVMAIENTIAGSLLANHELLRKSNMRVVGEYRMPISHVLCALPGQSVADITEVHSHPMALMQCEAFLRGLHDTRMIEDYDTAGSARDIANQQISGRAAVCGEYAARLYGLEVLQPGIETNKRNFTRFLVLADPLTAGELMPPEQQLDKSSIVFTLPHSKGALSKILTILTFYDLNLTKIQSTPVIGREWEYRFYVDLTFDSLLRYHQAIDAVRPLMNEFQPLGLYKETEL